MTENYYPDRGGMSESCDRITYFLRKSGVTLHIFHFTNRIQPFFTEKILKNGSYTSLPLGNDLEHSYNLIKIHLEDFLKSKKIDAIVAFGGIHPVFLGPIFSDFFQIPLLTFFRGNDFDTSIFSHRKRESVLHCIKKSKLILVNSRTKQRYISNLNPESDVAFVPNGIDIKNWNATPGDLESSKGIRKEFPDSNPILGLFGQLKTKKGVPFFLESVLSIQKQAFSFLIIGELDEEIESIFISNHLSYKKLTFSKRESLVPYYLSCDAIALPSYYEGMPNVLIEASALGIPTIGSSVDGISDFFEDFEIHFLFKPGDRETCKTALLRFIQSEKTVLSKLSEKLKSKIRAEHTAEKEAEMILLKMNSVLN